jgi:hypothetical protein
MTFGICFILVLIIASASVTVQHLPEMVLFMPEVALWKKRVPAISLA